MSSTACTERTRSANCWSIDRFSWSDSGISASCHFGFGADGVS
ncbi:hypothetical protein [Streptomyces adustus]|nr:hypothetical protein [Streptomyces adustus]